MFLGLWELDTMCFDHIHPCSAPAPPRPIQILLTHLCFVLSFFFHPSNLISPDHKLLTMWTSSPATLVKKTYCPSPSSQTKGGTSCPPPLSMLAFGFSQVSCMFVWTAALLSPYCHLLPLALILLSLVSYDTMIDIFVYFRFLCTFCMYTCWFWFCL